MTTKYKMVVTIELSEPQLQDLIRAARTKDMAAVDLIDEHVVMLLNNHIDEFDSTQVKAICMAMEKV